MCMVVVHEKKKIYIYIYIHAKKTIGQLQVLPCFVIEL